MSKAELTKKYNASTAENAELKTENYQLKHELVALKRMVFGRKSERFVPEDPDQLSLNLGDKPSDSSEAEETETLVYTRKKPKKTKAKPSRQPLPAHLPREDQIIDPQEDTTGMKRIGEEITEILEYKPGRLYVKRIIRPKYAKPNDGGVLIGKLPSRPIEKGIAGPGLLAYILISKFVDHLPLYRIIQMLKRENIKIPDSTIGGWVSQSCDLLVPLGKALREKVLQTKYLKVDETTLKVADKKIKGKTHQGYLWGYYDFYGKNVFFDYNPSRSDQSPAEVLKDFQGHLQSDGYQVYDAFDKQEGIIGIGCMAHARRGFEKTLAEYRTKAEWMLTAVGKLYTIEHNAKIDGLSFDEIYHVRQKYSLPVLQEIRIWLDEQSPNALPSSLLGKAITYMNNQWKKLIRYCDDGMLHIDNNLLENLIRPIAIGRKNYLFAGSHDAAKRIALIYSLVATAKLHGLNPYEYLKDVLTRIADYPHKQVADLLPHNWKKANPTI